MEYSLSAKLFSKTKAQLTAWPGHQVGMSGVKGIVARNHSKRDSRQTAKVSNAAFAIEKMINQKLSVCPIMGQSDTYLEYTTSNGDVICFIVGYDKFSDFFNVFSDKKHEFATVSAVFASVAYNETLQQDLIDAGFDVSEVKERLANMPNVSAEEMLLACDAFYYAVGKSHNVSYEYDPTKFDAQMTRLAQSNLFTHDNPTVAPSGVLIGGAQQQKKEVQPSYFTEPLSTFFDRCKNGEFIIDYNWNDFQKQSIKPLSFLDKYVPTEVFREQLLSVYLQIKEILRKMEAGMSEDEVMSAPVNMQIMGKPGTGKTTMVEAILTALGYPRGFTNCKGRSEEDEFEGLNKFVNGKVFSIPTKFAQFFSIGGAVLLEEINLPDPDIMQGAIGQALVYPYVLKVDGYKEYKRHPLTIVIGTLNVGTDGTKPMNQGFSSRLDDGCILEDVADSEFKEIVYSTGYPKKNCDISIKAYKAAMQYLMDHGNDEYCLSITLRGCKKAAQKLTLGFTKEQAFKSAYIAQIYSRDMDVANDLLQTLLRAV